MATAALDVLHPMSSSDDTMADHTSAPTPVSPSVAVPATPRSAGAATSASTPLPSPRTSERLRGRRPMANPCAGPSATAGTRSEEKTEEPAFLQPYSFYPLNNHLPQHSSPTEEIRVTTPVSPNDDPECKRGIPIFRPSVEEFQDFEAYVTRTVPWGSLSGIVKIVPPAEWTDSLPQISKQRLAHVEIRNPIQQNMFGSAGLFRQTNVEKNKNRPLSVEQWFDKCREGRFVGPSPGEGKEARAKRKRNEWEEEKKARREKNDRRRSKKAEQEQDMKNEGPDREGREDEAGEARADVQAESSGAAKTTNSHGRTGESSSAMATHLASSATTTEHSLHSPAPPSHSTDPVPPLDPSSSGSAHSSPDPIATTPEADAIPPFYHTFDPRTSWLPEGSHPEDYTVEACAQLERQFWKGLGVGEPGWYGADLLGSLFEDPETRWNVANLPNLLNRYRGKMLPGVNSPYLYFGMWRAAFAWHVEDMDLFSINYIHFGAPKFWYAIPQAQAEKFERTLAGYFPHDSAACDQFLRHKSFTVSPSRLQKDHIHVNMLAHNQGEFVITYPKGYHAGFNLGFNCAESVNFALDSWVELGRRAKVCQCVGYSVRIDVDDLIADPEAELVKQEAKVDFQSALLEHAAAERKAKRPRSSVDGQAPRRKRARVTAEGQELDTELDYTDVRFAFPTRNLDDPEKKIIPLSKPSGRKALVQVSKSKRMCILCPDDKEEDLLDVWEASEGSKQKFAEWGGKVEEGVRAHMSCVNSIPETYLEDRAVGEGGEVRTVVMNVDGIMKDRWNLKCAGCPDKRTAMSGAKIQCTKGKCPKAFHVSCAATHPDVVLKVYTIDTVELGTMPEGAAPDFEPEKVIRQSLKTECLCPSHNPEIIDRKKRAAADELKRQVLALPIGTEVKVKKSGSSYLAELIGHDENAKLAIVLEGEPRTQKSVPWTMLDLRPGPAPVRENEYAKQYQHPSKPATSTQDREREAPPVARRPADHPVQGLFAQSPLAYRPSTVPPQAYPSGRMGINSLIHPSPHQSVPEPQRTAPLPHNLPQHPPRHPHPHAVQHYRPSEPIPNRVILCDSHGQPEQLFRAQHYGSIGLPSPSQHLTRYPQGVPPFPTYPGHPSQGYGHAPPQPMAYHAPYALTQHHRPAPQWQSQYPPQNGHHSSAHYAAPPAKPIARPAQMPPHAAYTLSNGDMAPPPFAAAPGSIVPGSLPNGTPHRGAPAPNGVVGEIKPGLERMQRLMSLLRPIVTPTLHLAGTNGKGSVSILLESCLRAAGLRVARYNSPHLLEPRDAIAFDGKSPPQAEYQAAVQEVEALSKDNAIGATSFEVATAGMFCLVERYRPDVLILECGMGGAQDATNVLPPELVLACGLTSVGLDHTAFLGDTVEAIARAKAGIVPRQGRIVVGKQEKGEVLEVVSRVAGERQARVILAGGSRILSDHAEKRKVTLETLLPPPPLQVETTLPSGRPIATALSLEGPHQLDNLSLALAILDTLRTDSRAAAIQPKVSHLTDKALQLGVEGAKTWPGRCSWVKVGGTPMLVDGAHNAEAAARLRSYVDSLDIEGEEEDSHGLQRRRWIIGLSESKGKSVESVLGPMLRKGDQVVVVEFATPVQGMPWVKAVDAKVVGEVARRLVGEEGSVRVIEGKSGVEAIMEAMEGQQKKKTKKQAATTKKGLTIVAGSLYLAGDLYRMVEGV